MFFESFHKTPAGILVNRSVLVGPLPFCFIDEAGCRNEFHIDLDTLAGILHLLARLWDVFGVRKFPSHDTLFPQEMIQTGNGTLITTLHEFHPKDNQSGMGIAPAHILDEFDFFRCMLVGVVMRTARTASEGFNCTVIATLPAINILTVGFIFDSFRNAIFFSEG